jgi:hypothetical protein
MAPTLCTQLIGAHGASFGLTCSAYQAGKRGRCARRALLIARSVNTTHPAAAASAATTPTTRLTLSGAPSAAATRAASTQTTTMLLAAMRLGVLALHQLPKNRLGFSGFAATGL